MSSKAEISWKRVTPEGERRQVYAHHVGNQWLFFIRRKRFDNWEPMPEPPLEDWLELLDAIRRRVPRRKVRPEEVDRVEQKIRALFPDEEI